MARRIRSSAQENTILFLATIYDRPRNNSGINLLVIEEPAHALIKAAIRAAQSKGSRAASARTDTLVYRRFDDSLRRLPLVTLR